MGLVTTFCPLMTTGAGDLVLQTAGELTLVLDCKVNPAGKGKSDFSGQKSDRLLPSISGPSRRVHIALQ